MPVPSIAGRAALVRESWRALAPHGDALVARFHARLAAEAPSAYALFASTDAAAHGRKLLAVLGYLVTHLDAVDVLAPAAAALGHRHASYGVRAVDYGPVADALLHAVRDTLGADATPAVHAAWAATLTGFATIMRRAAASADRH